MADDEFCSAVAGEVVVRLEVNVNGEVRHDLAFRRFCDLLMTKDYATDLDVSTPQRVKSIARTKPMYTRTGEQIRSVVQMAVERFMFMPFGWCVFRLRDLVQDVNPRSEPSARL